MVRVLVRRDPIQARSTRIALYTAMGKE